MQAMSSFTLVASCGLVALELELGAHAQQTRTAFEFSRPVDTCAEEGDRTIAGTSRVSESSKSVGIGVA